MTLTLVGDVVDRILNVWLLGTYSAQINILESSMTDSTNEINADLSLGELGAGSFVAIEDELLYVIERDTTNNRLVVARGQRGTAAAAHAAGASMEINPRFPRWLIREVLASEILAWPESLYTVASFSETVAAYTGVIEIPEAIGDFTIRHPLKVRRASQNAADAWVRRGGRYETELGFTGGNTINLDDTFGEACAYHVLCVCDFAPEVIEDDTQDLVVDVGLAKGMIEILEVGAAYRLLMGRGSVRLFSEAEEQSRSATEVDANDIPQLAQGFLGLQERGIARESRKLLRLYGFGRG